MTNTTGWIIVGALALLVAALYADKNGAQPPPPRSSAEPVPTLPAADIVKSGIETNTQGQVKVAAVRESVIKGLYEVTTPAMDLFYADATGRYSLVEGRLVDMRDKRDLTSVRLDELRRIDFKTLPLELAFKTGTGSRLIAVFEDPLCPICRPLHKFLAQIPDTTVYHFPYPVISNDSFKIAATAWCSPDKAAVWNTAMTFTGMQLMERPSCDISGIKAILDLGERLQVQGTPTVFLADGRRLQGATPPEAFMDALEQASKASTAQLR